MPTTVQRNMVYTTTDSTLEKRDISTVIDLLDPFETPMLDMVGRDSLHTPCSQVKHEFIEDRLIPRAGTLLSAHVAGSGTFVFNTGEGNYLVIDDMFMVGDVVYQVVSGPPGTDTLQVTTVRGTDAAFAASSIWRKIAHAAPEGGSAKDDNRKTVASLPYNYTQILKDWAIVTGTMKNIPRYGYVSERAYNEEKVLKNLALDLEYSLLYGVRSYEAGPPRKSTMGGLFEFVYIPGVANSWSHIVDAAAGDLTETMLNNALQAMWVLGAKPDFMMLNGTNKRRVTAWGRPFIRTERTESTAGASVGAYESDFGTVDIILNRNLRPADVILGTKGSLGIGPLSGRAFQSRLLPSTLDGEWWEILGEYTMEVHRASMDFGWIYNTSTVY